MAARKGGASARASSDDDNGGKKRTEDRTDRLDELSTLSRLGVVERSLNDVVGEPARSTSSAPIHRCSTRKRNSRITQQTLKPLLVEELVNDGATSRGIGDADALLDDVGRELLRREGRDVAEELANDGLDEPVVVEVENVLNDVVALTKPNERQSRASGETTGGERNARKRPERA